MNLIQTMSLHSSIQRHFVRGKLGRLELLSCPATKKSTFNEEAPILFIHGGFHSASCFRLFLPYISAKFNIPCYALSLTAHGQSYRPHLLKTLSLTPHDLSGDVAAAITHISSNHSVPPIICGHSAGGALSQYFLQDSRFLSMKIRGLITIASIPASGAFPVFQNWFEFDKGLIWRSIKMGGHPRAPIATPELMCGAFFSPKFIESPTEVDEVWNELETIESLAWPAMLQLRFADESSIRSRLSSKVSVIGATLDRIITPEVVRKAASAYGVSPVLVQENGHDLMLDLNWKASADEIGKAAKEWTC